MNLINTIIWPLAVYGAGTLIAHGINAIRRAVR